MFSSSYTIILHSKSKGGVTSHNQWVISDSNCKSQNIILCLFKFRDDTKLTLVRSLGLFKVIFHPLAAVLFYPVPSKDNFFAEQPQSTWENADNVLLVKVLHTSDPHMQLCLPCFFCSLRRSACANWLALNAPEAWRLARRRRPSLFWITFHLKSIFSTSSKEQIFKQARLERAERGQRLYLGNKTGLTATWPATSKTRERQ